jgi:hypothetical protein
MCLYVRESVLLIRLGFLIHFDRASCQLKLHSSIAERMATPQFCQPTAAQMAAMNSSAPFTRAEVDDYNRRLGARSPTQMDAIVYSFLTMRMSKRLNAKQVAEYKDAIQRSKSFTYDSTANMNRSRTPNPRAGDAALIVKLEVGWRKLVHATLLVLYF